MLALQRGGKPGLRRAQPALGVAATYFARRQHAGDAHQHQQHREPAEHRHRGAHPRRFHRQMAFGEMALLMLEHRRADGTDLLHQLAAAAIAHQLDRIVPGFIALQVDHLLQQVEPHQHQLAQRARTLQLFRIVLDQHQQPLQVGTQPRAGLHERLQVVSDTGDQVATLAGLGIDDAG